MAILFSLLILLSFLYMVWLLYNVTKDHVLLVDDHEASHSSGKELVGGYNKMRNTAEKAIQYNKIYLESHAIVFNKSVKLANVTASLYEQINKGVITKQMAFDILKDEVMKTYYEQADLKRVMVEAELRIKSNKTYADQMGWDEDKENQPTINEPHNGAENGQE